MKQIWAITKVEISQLFFSPIAWLIIVLFTYQVDDVFSVTITRLVTDQDLYGGVSNLTSSIFANFGALWRQVQENLYLFIPLLTMGLMSRDLSSGSIKLLYSSPVTSSQIIIGKYLSVMIFSLILTCTMIPNVVFASMYVENLDLPLVLSGMLGLILLMWAYAAIGLFMSSITNYQIVAALLTLGTLTLINGFANIGQNVEFLRDITYWASISGRAESFIEGLISTEDIIYFTLYILMFLSFSIFLLQYRKNNKKWQCVAKYVCCVVAVLLIGYVTSRPGMIGYYDATHNKVNTLTENSRKIVESIDGPINITTYVNLADYDAWMGAPASINDDIKRYKQYLRFKPDINMDYVYYYDEAYSNLDYGQDGAMGTKEMAVKFADGFGIPFRKVLAPEEIRERIDLVPEKNDILKMLEGPDGKSVILRIFDDMVRFPDEQEITTAFNLLQSEPIRVGFLTGHGERSIFRDGDIDYSGFTTAIGGRHALVNMGYDVSTVDLHQGDSLSGLDLLVIADLRRPLTKDERRQIMSYISNGGNMLLAVEPKWIENAGPILSGIGVYYLPGSVVYMNSDYSPSLVPSMIAPYGQELSHLMMPGITVSMNGCASLDYSLSSEWDVIPMLISPDSSCWNEVDVTNFEAIDDKNVLSASDDAGEFVKMHTLGLALMRKVDGREQRIAVLGDADCLSNMEMTVDRRAMNSHNSFFCRGLFHWLSDGKSPIDVRRPSPIDNEIALTVEEAEIWAVFLKWLLPVLLALIGTFIVMLRLRR